MNVQIFLSEWNRIAYDLPLQMHNTNRHTYNDGHTHTHQNSLWYPSQQYCSRWSIERYSRPRHRKTVGRVEGESGRWQPTHTLNESTPFMASRPVCLPPFAPQYTTLHHTTPHYTTLHAPRFPVSQPSKRPRVWWAYAWEQTHVNISSSVATSTLAQITHP